MPRIKHYSFLSGDTSGDCLHDADGPWVFKIKNLSKNSVYYLSSETVSDIDLFKESLSKRGYIIEASLESCSKCGKPKQI